MTYDPNPAGENASYGPYDGKPPAESKFAALTAGLLARKGEAEPALEPFAHARVAAGSARQMAPGARHDINRQAANDGLRKTADPHPAPAGAPGPAEDPFPAFDPEPPSTPAAPPAKPVDDAPRFEPGKRRTPQQAVTRFADDCPRQKIAMNPKRAAVTFRMSVHDFLRLKLASAELEAPSQELIIDAIEAYLDAHGVERLDECVCLQKAATACGHEGAAG